MQLAVTFRHMEPSEPIRQYVVDKIQRIRKYFPDPLRAQVVLSLERFRHKADILITLHNGLAIKGKELTDDRYSSIDLVMEKIDHQVRRYKDRIQSHRPSPGPELLVHHGVMEAGVMEAGVMEAGGKEESAREEAVEGAAAAPPKRKIIKSSRFFAKPMSAEEAILQMNLLGNDFLVFVSADTKDVNVVYKRSDGHYGLIETGRSAE
jgi:putative sigma-54 modulation protein